MVVGRSAFLVSFPGYFLLVSFWFGFADQYDNDRISNRAC
jgi:hypothetical protein